MGVVDPFSAARSAGLELIGKSEGLTLTDGTMELRADFGRMLPRLKQGRLQQELLVKAARAKGIESPWAIDATAGFGEDSLLLAAAGFTVDLYEQDCVIAALLKDALDRAADDPALATAVARMRLHAGEDSIAGLYHTAELIGRGELTAPSPPAGPPPSPGGAGRSAPPRRRSAVRSAGPGPPGPPRGGSGSRRRPPR